MKNMFAIIFTLSCDLLGSRNAQYAKIFHTCLESPYSWLSHSPINIYWFHYTSLFLFFLIKPLQYYFLHTALWRCLFILASRQTFFYHSVTFLISSFCNIIINIFFFHSLSLSSVVVGYICTIYFKFRFPWNVTIYEHLHISSF